MMLRARHYALTGLLGALALLFASNSNAQIIYRPTTIITNIDAVVAAILAISPSPFSVPGHTHSGVDITSGEIAVARYDAYGNLVYLGKIGTNATQVAQGDHTHDLGTLAGTLANDRYNAYSNLVYWLSIGTNDNQVAAGDHNHPAYELRMDGIDADITDLHYNVGVVSNMVGAEIIRAMLAEQGLSNETYALILSNNYEHSLLDIRLVNIENRTSIWEQAVLDVAVLETQKVDVVDFIPVQGLSETNQEDIAILSSRVGSNELDIAILETQKVDLVTYDAHLIDWGNTNAGLQTQIVNVEGLAVTNQAAIAVLTTNTVDLATYDALDVRVTDVEGLAETNQTRIIAIENQTHVNTLNSITGGVQIVGRTNTTVQTDGTNIYFDSTGGIADLSGWSGYPATQAVDFASFTPYGIGTPGYYIGSGFYAENDSQIKIMFDDTTMTAVRKSDMQMKNLSITWFGVSNLYSAELLPRRGFAFVPNGNYGADAFSKGIFLGENGTSSQNCVAVDCYPIQGLNLAINGNAGFSGNMTVGGTSTLNNATVSTLQITGGNPTNGAVWVVTNTAGQGALTVFPYISAYNTTNTTYPDNGITTIPFGTLDVQRGGTWDGTNWTPGVVGMTMINVIAITTYPLTKGHLTLTLSGVEHSTRVPVARNNSDTYFPTPFPHATWLFYNNSTTNSYSVRLQNVEAGNITNKVGEGVFSTKFTGTVLP